MQSDRKAAIVGIHEYPLRVARGVSAMQIKVDSIRAALADAGLQWSQVDALYDAGDGEAAGGLQLSSYLGLNPTVIDTTNVGGSSFEFHAAHALRDIAAGKCKVAVEEEPTTVIKAVELEQTVLAEAVEVETLLHTMAEME